MFQSHCVINATKITLGVWHSWLSLDSLNERVLSLQEMINGNRYISLCIMWIVTVSDVVLPRWNPLVLIQARWRLCGFASHAETSTETVGFPTDKTTTKYSSLVVVGIAMTAVRTYVQRLLVYVERHPLLTLPVQSNYCWWWPTSRASMSISAISLRRIL